MPMRIICSFSTLLRIALLALFIGLIAGFYAGQHVAANSATTSSDAIPEHAGTEFAGGGEFEWSRTPI
jgi:hypothetical protein